MPSFTFTSPEGKSYTVNGPEGATKEQAWGILQQQMGGAHAEPTQAKPAQQLEESGGFFTPAATALKETVSSYIPAAKLFTGLGDQKAATEELLKNREAAGEVYRQTEFSEIGDAFKKGNIGEAVGKLVDKTKEVAGASLGAMGPAIAAGQAGTMMGGPVAGLAAFGITGFGSYLADYIGRQKEEQQKQGREGEDINRVSAVTAAAFSSLLDVAGGKIFKPIGALMGIEGRETAERAAMEIIEAATKPGAYKRAVLKGTAEGLAFEVPQEVAQQVLERWQAGLPLNPFDDPEAAREYGEAAGGALLLGGPMGGASKVMETRRARQTPEGETLLKGLTKGAALDTLSQEEAYDPEARLAELQRKGFGTEARTVTGPDGKPMTIPGGQGNFFTRAEKEEYDALKEGRPDAARTRYETARASAEMAGQPGAVRTATGAGEPVTSRVVPPRQSVSEAPEGEIDESGALVPSKVDEYAARAASALGTTGVGAKYGDMGEGATAAKAAATARGLPVQQRLQTFQEQYEELRNEILSMSGRGLQSPEQTRKIQIAQKNLNEIVDANADVIADPKLVQQFKNPVFNGTRAIQDLMLANEPGESLGAPRQMGMLPSAKAVHGHLRAARIASGADAATEVERLQGFMERFRKRTDPNNITMEVAQKVSSLYGVKLGDVFNNPELVSRYIDDMQASVDQAINDIQQRKGSLGARPKKIGPQPDLFSRAQEKEEEEFGAPIPGEQLEPEDNTPIRPVSTERAGPPSLEESEVGNQRLTDAQIRSDRNAKFDVDTHTVGTEEGRTVQKFFDSIHPAAESGTEKDKHEALRQNAAASLTSYDIVEPATRTSPALKLVQELLASHFGGVENFNRLLDSLNTMSPGEQSRLFKKQGLPDLTTRRGLEQFYHDIQVDLEHRSDAGVKIPTRSMPAVGLPQTKATIPHTESFTTHVGEARTPKGVMQEGREPRSPEMVYKEVPHVLSDTKVRRAINVLRQKFELRKDLTKEDLAAIAYLNNSRGYPEGEKVPFYQAFRALAFDLAMYKLNPKGFTANYNYVGEGGAYAERFRDWVEKNLDKNTVDLLNELVAEETQTAEALKKFAEAKSERDAKRDRLAEERRKEAERNSGKKIPRAPRPRTKRKFEQPGRVTSIVGETEATELEDVYEPPTIPPENLPRVFGVYQVHPDIRNAIERGDTQKALKIMSEAKGNPYYAALAKRLLESGVTAKIDFVDSGVIQPLDNNPETLDSFKRQLNTLRTLAIAIVPKEKQAALFAKLRSDDRTKVFEGITELVNDYKSEFSTSEAQTVANTIEFARKEFGWDAQYDPNTDKIIFRRDAYISNAVFLHEVVHAATAHLVNLGEQGLLKGRELQAYNQLNELFNHSKNYFKDKTITDNVSYGLTKLDEFIAEVMTNPDFQAALRNIEYKNTRQSIYSRFMHSVRLLFGINDNSEVSNVFNEAVKATDGLMAVPKLEKLKKNRDVDTGNLSVKSVTESLELSKKHEKRDFKAEQQQLPLAAPSKHFPMGRPNTPTAFKNLMTSRSWDEVKDRWPAVYANMKAELRPMALGALTLRQIADLVNKRIPQLDNFVRETEAFLARKNEILTESGDISKRWEKLQSRDPQMSRDLAALMHRATLKEIDPDPTSKLSTIAQRQSDPELANMWKALADPEARAIYREVRDFYERRYSEYRSTLNKRLIAMRKFGVSDKTITDIRAEFEKSRRKGPYFPLMRHGRFWYQVGTGNSREYYMFESMGEMEAHLNERLAQDPKLEDTLLYGDQYQQQMDHHAKESQFLKSAFDAIDKSNTADKQELKDSLYQSWLSNQPESSFRNQFVHRQNVAGYSEDALRNFAKSSFHMAYQLSRFEHAPELFSQISAARMQLKDRIDVTKRADRDVMRENNELSDYVQELQKRLGLMLNPTDIGTLPSLLSNVGFIWYLTAPASAIVNVLGGMIIGLPTLVGQQVRLNPNMSYMKATLKALGEMKTVAAQIMRTGFQLEKGARAKDYMLHFPSLTRSSEMSKVDQAAYKLFVADGLIDITATYDQSGLAAAPTEAYTGTRHRVMQALSSLFHNAERFNREVMAMSAFRGAMEKRKGYTDKRKAFAESIAEAKDVTNRAMFDYSSTNKPRYFQHPVARIVLQFKQFPQQMTFFLAHNFVNMLKGATPEVKREATARFVGTMGMAAIFSGATGLWGFSTVASIINAVINGLDDDRDEPFDFELEFVNWAVETFGPNIGTLLARGAGNAAGIDLASRVKLDDMWFRDSRKNQDEVEALQSFLVDLLGPTVGLGINVAEAMKLWNQGHGDRALEMVSPAFIKQPMVAARYAREGANTLAGDPLVEEFGPFDLLMQSMGIRSSELAERQYYNITKKGQEQAILKERQNLLNLYGISFMSGDVDSNEVAFEKIMKFNNKHPTVAIPADSIIRSIKERATKSSQTDHGLYIDKRMRGMMDESYMKD